MQSTPETTSSSPPKSMIKSVLVLGATGSIGPYMVSELLASPHNFSVSILTRALSDKTKKFSSDVRVIQTDYTHESLVSAFEGIDAVVSCIATFSTHQQQTIIDAAIASGVLRFVPSEYGIDTSSPQIGDFVPPAKPKNDTVAYLRSRESESDNDLTWTAVIVGAFFDWVFQFPGIMGWDVPARRAQIFDGGDVEYEATNVRQIARAVVAALSPDHFEETANQYVYVNSFTTTQNRVLAALEKATAQKFQVEHVRTSIVFDQGMKEMNFGSAESEDVAGGTYMKGSVMTITAAIYGHGGFNHFSRHRGLWNERLGLPVENLEETVRKVVEDFNSTK